MLNRQNLDCVLLLMLASYVHGVTWLSMLKSIERTGQSRLYSIKKAKKKLHLDLLRPVGISQATSMASKARRCRTMIFYRILLFDFVKTT